MQKLILLFCILFFYIAFAKNNNTSQTTSTNYKLFNINNISTTFFNNGASDWNINKNSAGFYYPKWSNKTAVYSSGLMWGAKIDGDTLPIVGGSMYETTLQPGKIISPGTAEDTALPKNRIYRIRKDVYPGSINPDLSSEINDGEGDYTTIKAAYEKDWEEWPAADGAPFVDKNSNGIYEPNIDIPGVEDADQTLWYVANDLNADLTYELFGAPPLGIELQVTIWGYINPAVSNTLFRKYKLINKSNSVFNDMYVSMFSDIDIGNPMDDFAGCDTMLGLGYCYNGKNIDTAYGYTPPAVGFDFLNLPMTAFYYWFPNPGLDVPMLGDREWSVEYYNYMQGKIGLSGQYFFNPITKLNTRYALSGDPTKGEGWIDGLLFPANDRRIGLCSGPFQLGIGESKEIVVAEIAAMGNDRINSIEVLKKYDHIVQKLNDLSFDINSLPATPSTVQVDAYYNDNINLSWGNESESFIQGGYKFEGYNVYQLIDKDFVFKEAGKKIATFDLADGVTSILSNGDTLQTGTDSGLEHSLTVMHDALENYNLIKGKIYYFGLTAYTYNPYANLLQSSESLIKLIKVNFQDSLPGPNYNDKIKVVHNLGNGDADISLTVVDPALITGDDYQINFNKINDTTFWSLTDKTVNKILLNNQPLNLKNDYTIVDGVQIKVDSIINFKNFQVVANANGLLDPPEGAALDFDGFPSTRPTERQQVGDGIWAIHTYDNRAPGITGTNGKYSFFLESVTRLGYNWAYIFPYDYEMRFTNKGSKAYKAFENKEVIDVPFELWNIGIGTPNDPSDDYRMIPWIYENNGKPDAVDLKFDLSAWGSYDHSADVGNNDPWTDRVYWMDPSDRSPGEAGYLTAESQMIAGTYDEYNDIATLVKIVLINWNGGSIPPFNQELPETGTIFRILTTKPLSSEDIFAFNSNMITSVKKEEANKFEFKLYQNYPNPFNPITKIKFNLKENSNVQLKVYNILGQEIFTLLNNQNMQAGNHEIKFNGANLASGIYLYRLETEKFSVTKKLILLK